MHDATDTPNATTQIARLELPFRVARVGPGESVQQPIAWEVTPAVLSFVAGRDRLKAEKLVVTPDELERFEVLEVRIDGARVSALFGGSGNKYRFAELIGGSHIATGHVFLSHENRVISGLEIAVRNKTSATLDFSGVVLAS